MIIYENFHYFRWFSSVLCHLFIYLLVYVYHILKSSVVRMIIYENFHYFRWFSSVLCHLFIYLLVYVCHILKSSVVRMIIYENATQMIGFYKLSTRGMPFT